MRLSTKLLAPALALFAVACGAGSSARAPRHARVTSASTPATTSADASEVIELDDEVIELDGVAPSSAYGRWRPMANHRGCAVLAPDVVSDEIDLVFHFHAGQTSTREMRESGANAVFVSCGFGVGTAPYADAFADPNRFGAMLDDGVRSVESSSRKRGLRVRRLALASWSAGFAAVGRILSSSRWFDRVDAVILLDSLHARYSGADRRVEVDGALARFAKAASLGQKSMVITHSSIVPPGYASSAETTRALLGAIDIPISPSRERNARGMTTYLRADAGALHVRGFRGQEARDHVDHLHLIGDVLRAWVLPRWTGDDRLATREP
jgi:hypothetical protein